MKSVARFASILEVDMERKAAAKIWTVTGIVVGLVAASLAFFFTDHLDDEDRRFIFATLTTISVTLLGFVLAALSILSALIDRELVKRMKKAGHWEIVVRQLRLVSRLLLLMLVGASAALLIQEPMQLYLFAVVAFFTAWALVEIARGGRYLMLILEDPNL